MPILGEILKTASSFLKQKQISEPRLSAEWLLAFLLGMRRVDLYLNFDRPLDEQELCSYRALIARRLKHEPISYIMGRHPFYGLDLKVDPSVLIPRHETEELVELVLDDLKQDSCFTKVLDLGTGSGAIACALKSKMPQLVVHASDVSQQALNIAQANAVNHNLDICFHNSDLFSNIDDKFDVIVSNPPYIAKADKGILETQVINYEPHLALFGGDDGLDFYRLLKKELHKVLNPKGRLYLEIGFNQASDVMALFAKLPYDNVRCLKDINEKDRFVIIDYKN